MVSIARVSLLPIYHSRHADCDKLIGPAGAGRDQPRKHETDEQLGKFRIQILCACAFHGYVFVPMIHVAYPLTANDLFAHLIGWTANGG